MILHLPGTRQTKRSKLLGSCPQKVPTYKGKKLKTYNFKVYKVFKRCQEDKSTVQRISATGSREKISVVLNDHEV